MHELQDGDDLRATIERLAVEARTDAYPLDRTGNAQRLVDQHGHEILYVPEAGAWYVWDGTRWAQDDERRVFRMALAIAEHLYALAKDRGLSNEEAKTIFSWARQSADDRTVEGVLKIAASDPRVIRRAGELDRDPWLLNCPNGTIDLRTGELLPHDRRHLITKITAVPFDPEATSEAWNRAIEGATAGDEGFAEFLRRSAGMTLAGVQLAEVFLYVYGPGGSGKGTFTEALAAVLGDYAITALVSSFYARRRSGSGASGDIARMAGVRMVLTGEPDQGERLAAGLIKSLTGGDKITARHLFKREFEFRPQLTLWFAANDRLYVDHRDSGMFRRLVVAPFDHKPERPDPSIKATLLTDPEAQAAVLAWAVRGCLDWQADELSLAEPPAVREATAEYRRAMNPLAEFIEDRCAFDPDGFAATSDLTDAYNAWRPLSAKPITRKRMGEHLAAMPGLAASENGRARDGRRARGFRGIMVLASDAEYLDAFSSGSEDPEHGSHGYLPTSHMSAAYGGFASIRVNRVDDDPAPPNGDPEVGTPPVWAVLTPQDQADEEQTADVPGDDDHVIAGATADATDDPPRPCVTAGCGRLTSNRSRHTGNPICEDHAFL